jgi:hypothetical protein
MVCIYSILAGAVFTTALLMGFGGMGDPSGEVAALLYSFMVYVVLAYSYFHIFNMSETARRIRILYDVHRAGSLDVEAACWSYDKQSLLRVRIERLVSLRQIEREGACYKLRGRVLLYAARVVAFWAVVVDMPLESEPHFKGGQGSLP